MGKVTDPECPGLNPLCGLIFLHIPSTLYTQPVLSYLSAFLQGVCPPTYAFLVIITDQIQNYLFPTNASTRSSVPQDTFYFSNDICHFFSLALASFVTYTSPLCYLTIISLKIRQIHLQPCLLYLWEKKKTTQHTFVALKMELPLTK